MNILLIDVDSKIPNVALMRISHYYKRLGHNITLMKLGFDYYPYKNRNKEIIDATGYDKVFVSIIFKINKKVCYIINCDDVEIGGTGYDITKKLPECINEYNSKKDYSLYPNNKKSYGFLTRGCIRNCYFCFVPKKEGMIQQVNTINDVVEHKEIVFMDNNILAFKGHIELLKELRDKKIKCSFNQGLDLRLVNDENSKLLSELNYKGEYVFAFDNVKDLDLIETKLKILRKYIVKDWKIKMFLYCHPDMNIKNDIVFRINWCKKKKVLPYFMRDESCWNSKNRNFYIDLAGFCNQPGIFKKMLFEDFIKKRTNNVARQLSSSKLFIKGEQE